VGVSSGIGQTEGGKWCVAKEASKLVCFNYHGHRLFQGEDNAHPHIQNNPASFTTGRERERVPAYYTKRRRFGETGETNQ